MTVTERETLAAEAVFDLAARTDRGDALDLLSNLTAHIVALLGVRGAGTTVSNEAGEVEYFTATDRMCRRLEEAQMELGEGPCVDSTRSGAAVAPVTLAPAGPSLQRWPRYAPRAIRSGFSTVASMPLRAEGQTLGAVTLLCTSSCAPTPLDLRLAQVLADAAGAHLRQRQVLSTKDEVRDQLQNALHSRIVIEQAKGIQAARLGIDVNEAFNRLRSHARSRQQKLSDVAALTVRGAIPLDLDGKPHQDAH